MGTTQQRLTLFDLDNTLLAGDSDYGWGQFLIEVGAVDAATYERRNAGFFADYKAGRLDIHAFLDFQLRPLAEQRPGAIVRLARPLPGGEDRTHAVARRTRRRPPAPGAGDLVAVVTSTNSFVTQPIAQMYRHFESCRDGTGNDRGALHRAHHRGALLPGGQDDLRRMPGSPVRNTD